MLHHSKLVTYRFTYTSIIQPGDLSLHLHLHSSSTKAMIFQPPFFHPQLRNMQQNNRQAFNSPGHRAKGGQNKRSQVNVHKVANPGQQMSPHAMSPNSLPIILLDPTTGQPVGAVTPMRPNVANSAPPGTIMGLVPQGDGTTAPVAFMSVPIPQGVVPMQGTPTGPHQTMNFAPALPPQTRAMPPAPQGLAHHTLAMQGPQGLQGKSPYARPDRVAPTIARQGTPMVHSSVPRQPQANQNGNINVSFQQPQQASSPVKPREKNILQIIDPLSGREVTPKTSTPQQQPKYGESHAIPVCSITQGVGIHPTHCACIHPTVVRPSNSDRGPNMPCQRATAPLLPIVRRGIPPPQGGVS